MGEFGFISDKLEIKFLILYIAARLIQPVRFEMLQEASMCDGGVDYFGFSECLADLVRTEHLTVDGDGQYAITEKGRRNSAVCESSLPYSVRMRADEELAALNEQLKRRSLVSASMEPKGQGYEVRLSLSDELGRLMGLELLVTREDMGRELQKNFKAHAEEIYTKIMARLYGGN